MACPAARIVHNPARVKGDLDAESGELGAQVHGAKRPVHGVKRPVVRDDQLLTAAA